MLPFELPCAYYEGRRDSSRFSDQALQTSPFTAEFCARVHSRPFFTVRRMAACDLVALKLGGIAGCDGGSAASSAAVSAEDATIAALKAVLAANEARSKCAVNTFSSSEDEGDDDGGDDRSSGNANSQLALATPAVGLRLNLGGLGVGKLNLSALQREEVDDEAPAAVPMTPKETFLNTALGAPPPPPPLSEAPPPPSAAAAAPGPSHTAAATALCHAVVPTGGSAAAAPVLGLHTRPLGVHYGRVLLEELAKLPPLAVLPSATSTAAASAALRSALTMSETITDLASRCFDLQARDPVPEGSKHVSKHVSKHDSELERAPSLRSSLRSTELARSQSIRPPRLTALGEWRQHMRWYGMIVEQQSWEAPDSARTTYLDALRKLDNELQRVHPTFDQSRDTPAPGTPEQLTSRLELLHELHEIAISINLELLSQVQLPDEMARAHLPSRAAPLLPRTLARELRTLARELRAVSSASSTARLPTGALRTTLDALLDRLGLERLSPQLAAELLDRLERAAEVWQCSADRGAERLAAAADPPSVAVGERPRRRNASTDVTLVRPTRRSPDSSLDDRPERPLRTPSILLARISRERAPGAASGAGAGAGAGAVLGASGVGGDGLGGGDLSAGRSTRRSRWWSLLGRLNGHPDELRAANKALVARALAVRIRTRLPSLPPTGLERAKVAHTSSVANAMLEAYSRALAIHSQSAVRHYARLRQSAIQAAAAAAATLAIATLNAAAASPTGTGTPTGTPSAVVGTATCSTDLQSVGRAGGADDAFASGAGGERVQAASNGHSSAAPAPLPMTIAPISAPNLSPTVTSAAAAETFSGGGGAFKLKLHLLDKPLADGLGEHAHDGAGAPSGASYASLSNSSSGGGGGGGAPARTSSSRSSSSAGAREGASRSPLESPKSPKSHHMGDARPKWQVRPDEISYLERLGAGAYGEVHLGEFRRKEVAIKVLVHGDLHEDDFYEEMALLSDLRHENIVLFMGACLAPSKMCILYELCEPVKHAYAHYGAPTSSPQVHPLRALRGLSVRPSLQSRVALSRGHAATGTRIRQAAA